MDRPRVSVPARDRFDALLLSARLPLANGRSAVQAALDELESSGGFSLVVAVLKSANYRSLGLLRSLGIGPASPQYFADHGADSDELLMVKPAGDGENAA